MCCGLGRGPGRGLGAVRALSPGPQSYVYTIEPLAQASDRFHLVFKKWPFLYIHAIIWWPMCPRPWRLGAKAHNRPTVRIGCVVAPDAGFLHIYARGG
jgi:hypothetical protein